MPVHSTQDPPYLAHVMVKERRAKATIPHISRAGVLCEEQSLPQPRKGGQECRWNVGMWVEHVKALPALPVCVSPKLELVLRHYSWLCALFTPAVLTLFLALYV